MNRGFLQNSPVQQIMAAGNPSFWNINNLMRPPYLPSSSSPLPPSSTTHFLAPPPNPTNHIPNHNNNIVQPLSCLDDPHHPTYHNEQQRHQLPQSLSQLLLGGVFMGEEAKKMESWEEQVVFQHQQHPSVVDAKKESSVNSYSPASYNPNNNDSSLFSTYHHEQEIHQLAAATTNWSPQISIPASSPQSCVTTFSSSNPNSMLDFSSKSSDDNNLRSRKRFPAPDHSSEGNSATTCGVFKKAKVQPSAQSTFKVRKEKLGDRVTALHQLVSPFGKTDTASVLLEAIGYIKFLHNQVEALSLPYLSSAQGDKRLPHPVQGERKCMFPEDPGQLSNENCLKRKRGPSEDSCKDAKDLSSRGLCLVPVSCTLHVGSDNGADYWAPALGGCFQ